MSEHFQKLMTFFLVKTQNRRKYMGMEEQRVYISELVPFQPIPECKKSQRVILMPTIALGVDRTCLC